MVMNTLYTASLYTYDMNKIMILATIATVAAGITLATTGPAVITSVVAQATDNATMTGNMTAGNATDSNSTEAVGGISGIGDDPFT
jgi:hypothetical protein